jgi:hypothetical protein
MHEEASMAWWKFWTWLPSAHIGDPPRTDHVACYEVVLDAPLTLATGADIDTTFRFTLGGVAEGRQVIISFLLIRADNLRLSIQMNDLSFTRDYIAGAERTVHEVIGPAGRIGDNELTVRVLQGFCRFSDLIVWYAAFL